MVWEKTGNMQFLHCAPTITIGELDVSMALSATCFPNRSYGIKCIDSH